MKNFHNKTRTSESIPRKLIRKKKYHLVPLYYLLTTSDLAREGIHHSGSYRFADHIYQGKPKGRHGIGKLLDYIFLNLPSAKAFQYRYHRVKEHLHKKVSENDNNPIKILYVPPGLAREYFEVDEELKRLGKSTQHIHFHGLDLDAELVDLLNERGDATYSNMNFFVGDALDNKYYADKYHLVLSTGFLDFLPYEEARLFFSLVYNALEPGGEFITSGMQPHKLSDYLMREFAELHTVYRSKDELIALATEAGFKDIEAETHKNGLQTVIKVKKQL